MGLLQGEILKISLLLNYNNLFSFDYYVQAATSNLDEVDFEDVDMPLPGTVTCSYTLLKIKNCNGKGTGTGTFLLVPV